MVEQKLKPDQWKNIDVRSINAGNFIKVKLYKGNKVFEKEIEKKDGSGSFTIYSVGVLHDGNECYMKVTPALSRNWKNFKMGDVVQVFAMPSQLKGGKAYMATCIESENTDTTTSSVSVGLKEQGVFAQMMTAMMDAGLTLSNVDDTIIRDTLFADHKYSPEDAEALVPQFKKYYEQHQ